MSDPMFNDRTYADNLDFISDDDKALFSLGAGGVGWIGNILVSLNAEAAAAGKNLNGFLAQYNDSSKPLPQTWDAFITAFRRDFLGQDPPLPPETSANNTFSNAVQAFITQSGQDENAGFGASVQISLANEGVPVNFASQFKKAFGDFLQHYPYKANGSVGTSTEFFQNLNEFFGVIATVLQDGNVFNPGGQQVVGKITSFEEIFQQFPSPTETKFTTAGTPFLSTPTFQERFAQFYKAYVAENGYFATGRALNEWTQEIQSEYQNGGITSYAISPAGASGVKRAVSALTTTPTEKALFQGDNFDAYTASSANTFDELAASLVGVTDASLFVDVQNPQLDTTTDTLTFDQTVAESPFINPDGSIGAYTLKIPANIINDVDAIKSFLKVVIQQFSFKTTTSTPGTKFIGISLTSSTADFSLRDTVDVVPDYTVVNTSVTTDSTVRVLVLNRIFKLMGDMIDIMQQATAAQSGYLTFLTQWQKAYTDLISEIKTYSRLDGSVFGRVDATDATTQTLSNQRGDANTANLNARERLSNLRSVVSDIAKRAQSRINQSQDAATQQGQFATSILQELSTILAAIYR